MHTTVEGKRQAERRTCLCHEEALPLEKQRAVQKQRPIAEARNVKFSKPPRAERNFLLTFFLLKKNMRAARAIVKTQIAGVTMCRHPHHAGKLGPPCMMCPERKKIRLGFHKCLGSKRLMLCPERDKTPLRLSQGSRSPWGPSHLADQILMWVETSPNRVFKHKARNSTNYFVGLAKLLFLQIKKVDFSGLPPLST